MKLSVVIPAHNEEGCIEATIRALHLGLKSAGIVHEIIAVNDGSTDSTESLLQQLQTEVVELKYVNNLPPHGFGLAVRRGFLEFQGDAVALYMADSSDSPEDLVRFFKRMESEPALDCVFGTRFSKQSKVIDYPPLKLFLNRLANIFIQVFFGLRYNDITNAFKLYRKNVIIGVMPLLSQHFNLTVEIPLKAIVRGFTFEVLPNSWTNRKAGESKLKIKEMGSRYLFIVLYCFIEKWLSRGDYYREEPEENNDPLNESIA